MDCAIVGQYWPYKDNTETIGTKIIFYHVFESADIRKRIAKFAGDANEQNLDRLSEVLRATASNQS